MANPYADVYDFVVFWGVDTPLSGVDNSGGAGHAFLTDTEADFAAMGVPLAAPVRNLTRGSKGLVSALGPGPHVLQTAGLTWSDGDVYSVVNAGRGKQAAIEIPLDMAAGDVGMALGAVDALGCAKSTQGQAFLRQLTCTIAVALYNAPCGNANLSDAMRHTMIEWVEKRLEGIRDGSIEVCQGYTGADWPAVGWATPALTDRTAAHLVVNRLRRGG